MTVYRSRASGKEINLSGNLDAEGLSAWRFGKKCAALDRFKEKYSLNLFFLTLTQAGEDCDYRWITRTMHAMEQKFKRAGLPFKYVAVLEIQPKRYASRGELVRHWHIVGAAPAGSLPHSRYNRGGEWYRGKWRHYIPVRDGLVITYKWLSENWHQKHGQYFPCDGWSKSVIGYLGKYIGKRDKLMAMYRDNAGRRVRRFSSSRFDLVDCMTDYLRGRFDAEVIGNSDHEELYWRVDGSRLVGRGREVVEVVEFDGRIRSRYKYPVVMSISGEWEKIESVSAECLDFGLSGVSVG